MIWAILHAILTLIAIGFQFLLALGAPWGHLAMGGRFEGRLPVAMRVAAVMQGGLLVAMTRVVAGKAGLLAPVGPDWLIWGILGVSALSAVMNLVTPSRAERLLWGPVTVIMLWCVVMVSL